ncbi:MAG: sigma-54 dependent transcriptional regulator [Planctomycetota bacterium]|nr:sigma-54 dependent transcriptional regulator [Planctomycetota bacterium]
MSTAGKGKDERAAILVADDDPDIRLALEMLLQYEGFEVWTAKDGREAWKRLEAERANGRGPALVLTDLKMPNVDGLELLDQIQTTPAPPPVILISGHGDVATAVDAMQRGASNFLEKPLDENRVLVTLRTTLREGKLAAENTGLRRQLAGRWEMVGESPVMERLRDQVAQVALSDVAVLVTGENGCGKEVVARNLHYLGPRAAEPFVTVNCAAIPGELIESELFGHEKGSFTGAIDRRVGHFEAADTGTLFLDEIGDMPLDAQAKVLRALETHEITRVGDSKSRPVDIRVVAATNADLTRAVEDKTFRMDLFYRLNVVPLRVPPLRERKQDLPLLVTRFLIELAERAGRSPMVVADEGLEFLSTLDWPGNVRQLRNVLEGAAVFTSGEVILREDLEEVVAGGPGLRAPSQGASASLGSYDPFDATSFEEFKNESEKRFFELRLARNDGNIKRTAEELGMQRSHLYKKLDRYGLR